MNHIHLIAIGGSAMHNLAIALKLKGYHVTGSDDEIFEPSKTRLKQHGLLPSAMGWSSKNIQEGLSAVIVGMHARPDNEELKQAHALKIPVYSYPEYLYNQAKEKQRLVVCGSHGKTTITAMVLHVLNKRKIDNDFMVGAQLDGFDCMVKLSEAPLMVLEGDEYLSSPEDRRPKFLHYQANVAILSGIAWDHINVFPTYEDYEHQFELLMEQLSENKATLVYNAEDEQVLSLVEQYKHVKSIPYHTPSYEVSNGKTTVTIGDKTYPINVFGAHNLQNMAGAQLLCAQIGVSQEAFYVAIESFTGAAKRLEKVVETDTFAFYKDFAHSPSKLKATTAAFKDQFPDRKMTACMELHTFSSLNKTFLLEYQDSMEKADRAIVYFNPETIAHKKIATISEQEVKEAFGTPGLMVFTRKQALLEELGKEPWENHNLLMMSSGNFDGISFDELGSQFVNSVKQS
jgi:UDP-N-acetylmuramate: L-alanyl-gamma-D-glutamyl-meso-diaminopimelate ligase